MDDEMDVDMDDLFGDGAGLALPARPPTKELLQRIDELRGSGACQGIAWSRSGSIAQITADGADLEFRCLQCRPKDGKWELSPPTTSKTFRPNNDGGPLQHLSWAPNGTDLAVIDAAGRISILSTYTHLNRLDPRRDCGADSVDDLHSVVGVFWLTPQLPKMARPVINHGPAISQGQSYRYENSTIMPMGPFFPNSQKSALICVTTNGALRIFWPAASWYEQTTELESVVSSDDLITHAAMCSEKSDTLLVALVTASRQLRVVRVMINFPYDEKTMAVGSPNIQTQHVAVTSCLLDNQKISSSNKQSSLLMDQISHLEFLCPSPVEDSSERKSRKDRIDPELTRPTILTARSSVPGANVQYGQEAHTIIDRWELQEKLPTLHPAFETISSRRNSTGSQPGGGVTLKKISSLTVNKILLSVEPIHLGRDLFLAYSDGSLEYRDRKNLAEIYHSENAENFSHISQVGFSFTDEEPCLQIAFSPTYCSAVQVTNDGKVKWNRLDYQLGSLESHDDIAALNTSPEKRALEYRSVIAGLTMALSTAISNSKNYDDILATANKHMTPQFAYDWLTEISRLLKLNADYSEEQHHDGLVRHTFLQIYLSMQNSMGFKGEFCRRTFAGKFSWFSLQLRNIVVFLTMAANIKLPGADNQKHMPLEDPIIINALSTSVRWCLELFQWIINSLFEISSTMRLPNPVTPEALLALNSTLIETNNVALHMVLSSPTRGYLTAICRRLIHLDFIAAKATAVAHRVATIGAGNQTHPIPNIPPDIHRAYTRIAAATQATQLPTKTFEAILASISGDVKSAYGQNKSLTPPRPAGDPIANPRNPIEVNMFTCGPLPFVLAPALNSLFETHLPLLRSQVLPEKLFFNDYPILQIADSPADLRRRKNASVVPGHPQKKKVIDVFRKVEAIIDMSDKSEKSEIGGRWRRCARCTCLMDDVFATHPRMLVQWMVAQQRKCLCSGFWVGVSDF